MTRSFPFRKSASADKKRDRGKPQTTDSSQSTVVERDARKAEMKKRLSELKYFYWSFFPIALIVVVHVVNLLPSIELRSYGILPRTTQGLLGILFSPFLHADFAHLSGNIMPLWVLLFVLAFFYGWIFWFVLPFLIVLSGLITWLIASGGAVHIGASGLVFALASFIALSGFLRKDFVLIAVAIFIAIAFQFLGAGLVPTQSNISYSSHWAGVSAGILASILFANSRSPIEKWKKRFGK